MGVRGPGVGGRLKMLRSMTGYASATARADGASVTVTLKSVNHRFLDLHVKLPGEVEALEPKLRQAVRRRLSRGHVDLAVVLEHPGAVEVRFDRPLIRGYLEAFRRLGEEFGVACEPDVNALLKLPGAFSVAPADLRSEEAQGLERLLFQALEQAMEALDRMRAEEARVMEKEMRARAAQIQQIAGRIEDLRVGADRHFFERLRDRLAELLGEAADRDRIAQEAALLVERSDVSEEVLRLKSHVEQFLALLSAPPEGEAGKRLDFLLQEMNRESSTILAKTAGLGQVGIQITEMGIQAKAEIEKLREQVQNLQ